MKKIRNIFIISSLLITSAFLIFLFTQGEPANNNGSRLNQIAAPTLKLEGSTIELEIAQTAEQRVRGLSGRVSLPENSGMLFIFEGEGEYGFWMKEMHFPIDIIWLDENFTVVDIKKNALPESYPELFYPKAPAQYVLEVNAGFAEAHNIKEGEPVGF